MVLFKLLQRKGPMNIIGTIKAIEISIHKNIKFPRLKLYNQYYNIFKYRGLRCRYIWVTIVAVLYLESEVTFKAGPTKMKTPPPSHCDELQEFLDHNVDKIVVRLLRK